MSRKRTKDEGRRMKKIRILKRGIFHPSLFILLPLICGCSDFGTGGTGELVVPKEQLHDIQGMDLQQLATTRPATTEPSTQPATQPAAEVTITLDEVRQMALQNNLQLKVDLLSPTIAQTQVSEEQARYESLFTTNTNYQVTDTPTSTRLTGSQGKNLQITPGVVVPLQTGGTLRFDLPMSRSETNNSFATLNPAYTSDFEASISHPLLRGAGLAVNAQGIRVAFYNYQITQAQTKLSVITVLAAAERVYWRLYAARLELEVRRKEYDLAVAQLERARRQVQFGAAAEVEVVRAESGVADTIETIITAENALRDRQREMKRIINQPGLEMGTPTILLPGTLPRPVPYEVDPQKLVQVALDQRMEMLEQQILIAEATSNVAVARNDLLPLLTLDYTYGVNGLGPSWDDSFGMVADKDFEDHRVGFQLEVPLGNQAARSRLRRALASRLQQLATREQRAVAIQQEVYNAVDQLEANWQRILAAQKRTILAARVLDAEIRQFSQQLRTSTDVLQAQTNLADAQLAEINALTEYQISQVDIAFATGMLLGASHVSWQPIVAPTR